MGMAYQGGIVRPHDSKVNALARLLDTAINLCTFLALVNILQLEWLPLYPWMLLSSVILFAFFSESSNTYRSWRGISLWQEITAIFSSWLAIVAVFITLDFVFKPTSLYNRELLLLWFIGTPIELISWHSIVRMTLNSFRKAGVNSRSVAILGATELGFSLEEKISEMPWAGYNCLGFYDDRAYSEGRRKQVQQDWLLGNCMKMIQEAKAGKIDIIFIALPLGAEKRIKQLLDELSDTTVSVYMMLDLFNFNLLSARWHNIQGMPVVSIYETPHTGIDNFTKRLFDIVVGSLILMLILIPMCVIALGIKLTSSGPVLFKQQRYGMRGEPISVWKFRSMRVMEASDGVVRQATIDDQRITPFGAFLRRTSLDELPQFFNVLAGSMSIVGPRPHAVSHNEHYRKEIYGYMLRHKVKPGITGLAQINGFRGETDTLDKMKARVRFDLEYIRNWSLFMDAKIVFLTIFKGFVNRNAY